MEIKLRLSINAPLELVWELLVEGTTTEQCPVTGIISHDVVEEYEDGVLQNVTFNGRPMLKRVFVDDENYRLFIEYKNKSEKEGEIHNQISSSDINKTNMSFYIQWFSDDATDEHHKELHEFYSKKLNEFKNYAESIWAQGPNTETEFEQTIH